MPKTCHVLLSNRPSRERKGRQVLIFSQFTFDGGHDAAKKQRANREIVFISFLLILFWTALLRFFFSSKRAKVICQIKYMFSASAPSLLLPKGKLMTIIWLQRQVPLLLGHRVSKIRHLCCSGNYRVHFWWIRWLKLGSSLAPQERSVQVSRKNSFFWLDFWSHSMPLNLE